MDLLLIIKYLFLGIIEGITEFLPISSTAHLILFSKLADIPNSDYHKFIEVFIQIGAILAVIFVYFKFVLSKKEIISKIIVSFIPTAVIAFVFYKAIKNVFFESDKLIALSLIIVGLLFIVVEMLVKKEKIALHKSIDNLNYSYAFLIGLIQAISIIPGISRAGAIILGMIILGFKRDDAVIYSFLLGVPTIIAAGFYDLYNLYKNNIIYGVVNNLMLINLVVSFIASFVFALLTIRWFLNFLRKNYLTLFGYYRIVLGIILLIYFLV
jgi:undecaprenyl-diphosphatase